MKQYPQLNQIKGGKVQWEDHNLYLEGLYTAQTVKESGGELLSMLSTGHYNLFDQLF